jgi:glycosyltransferase involved in cell wall biosynthesis
MKTESRVREPGFADPFCADEFIHYAGKHGLDGQTARRTLMRISVIVPAYNSSSNLRECLQALLEACPTGSEIIVVDDASTDETMAVAEAMGVRVLRLRKNVGPAVARNHGVHHAQGEILLFVDADVVVAPGSVQRMLATFADRPDLAAVFGSYDASPRVPGLVSQYRNLLHHYMHQTASADAFTFWSGCGAIRRSVFEAMGGFNENGFSRGMEDVELGYRLRRAGHRVRLDRALQVTHLKRWTLPSMVRTDIFSRAVPWARLIRQTGTAPSDLNLKMDQRLSLGCLALAALCLPWSFLHPGSLAIALLLLAAMVVLNRRLYRFFVRQRGLAFAAACLPLHVLYYVCGGVGLLYDWLVPQPQLASHTEDVSGAH